MPTRSACRKDDLRGHRAPQRSSHPHESHCATFRDVWCARRQGEHAARLLRLVHRRRKRARRHWRVSDDARRSAIPLTFSRRALREEPSDGAPEGPRTSPKREAQGLHVVLCDDTIRALTGAPRTLGQWSPMWRSRSSRRTPAANADVQRRLRAVRSPAQPRGWCPVSLEFLARLRPAGRTETLTEAITPRQYR